MGYDAYITKYHRTNKPNTVIIRNDSDINKVVNTVIENQDNFEYEDIDSWCSNGRYWMDFVYDNIDDLISENKNIEIYNNILNEMIELLDKMDECNSTYNGVSLEEMHSAMDSAKNKFFELFSKYFYTLWD